LTSEAITEVRGPVSDAFDHNVIAALGLQRQAIADRSSQRLGTRAGGDHHRVAGHFTLVRQHRHRLAVRQPQAVGRRRDKFGAQRPSVLGEGCDITAGIAATARFFDQHAELIARMQLRLALTHLVGRELQPGHADALADAPSQTVGVKRRARRIDVHDTLALDQVADTGFLGEFFVQGRRFAQQ
jgi:hypothetical protein